MQCPVCKTELRIMERQGIEIDYCPQCRGVWLDRGELDKIIDRSASLSQAEVRQPEIRSEARPEYSRPYPERDARDSKRYDDDDYNRGHKRHKKKNLLSELFDFD